MTRQEEKAKRIVNNFADLMLPNQERYNELEGIIAAVLRQERNLALEEAAHLTEKRKGISEHHSDIARLIRALKSDHEAKEKKS